MHQFPLSSQQKAPFLCFDCRISVKIPLAPYYEEIGEKRWAQLTNTPCPHCKKLMSYLGRYFKVPPRTALDQWRKAKLLWQNGWIADGYSKYPHTLRDARELLQMPYPRGAHRTAQLRAANEKRWRRLRAKRANRNHSDN